VVLVGFKPISDDSVKSSRNDLYGGRGGVKSTVHVIPIPASHDTRQRWVSPLVAYVMEHYWIDRAYFHPVGQKGSVNWRTIACGRGRQMIGVKKMEVRKFVKVTAV